MGVAVRRDPLATYDSLGRKQLKRVGLIELMRGIPWLLAAFDKTVPPSYYEARPDGEPHGVLLQCSCGATGLVVPFNVPTPCGGESCRRWFFYDNSSLRSAREPEGEMRDPETPVVD